MKTLKYEIAIKTGDEEAESLTTGNLGLAIAAAIKGLCGEITVVGLKHLSTGSREGNTKKPPKIRDEDIVEYETDKSDKKSEFKDDLEADGYTVTV